jgi:hypothetical protein
VSIDVGRLGWQVVLDAVLLYRKLGQSGHGRTTVLCIGPRRPQWRPGMPVPPAPPEVRLYVGPAVSGPSRAVTRSKPHESDPEYPVNIRRTLAAFAVTLVTASGLTVVIDVAAPPPAEAAVVKKRLVGMVKSLKVAREVRRGYDRDLFNHWVDADGDGCDTRREVLIAEARVKPRVTAGCDLRGGRWFSYYDGVRTSDDSSFDIDHMVPLAEAWDSGARRWNARTRQRFANDLGDRRALVAVSASSNRSKSDRDPREWMPRPVARCRYVREWTAVKTRWRLTVDKREKRALLRTARGCKNVVVRVRTARIGTRSTAGGGGGLDPRFDTCTEAKANGYGPYVKGKDPEYDWYTDADSDGVVCE